MHELESVQVARQNYNDVSQRKRMSRTSKIQTPRTRDKQRKKKQKKNPMTTTRIQRHIGNNTNTHTAFLAQFANPTHQPGKVEL